MPKIDKPDRRRFLRKIAFGGLSAWLATRLGSRADDRTDAMSSKEAKHYVRGDRLAG